MDETLEIRQARHRASIKWLLSKAYNNRVPDNLKEPFYRDHENQERLKPKIIVDLGNATLYCQTLSNLYSDPNYQSLNHWSILQTMARKGVPVNESKDMPLTETVLIQTNPLRIIAHMAVVESLMALYAKEITSNDRVNNAIRRISGVNYQSPATTHIEQSLLSWVSHTCSALKKRIEREVLNDVTDEQGQRLQAPDIPPVRDFQDLCDGICLALLISYYCPKAVQWTCVRINYLPAVEDSIHNVLLVSNFSQRHLPYNVFHMLPEDVTYMRGSMKLNLLVLLADLFNLFEIHPANCVNYPEMDSAENIAKQNVGANEHGICHRRGLTKPPVTPIPDLRSDLDQPTGSPTTRPQFQVTYTNSSSGTMLHKPHNIIQQQQPSQLPSAAVHHQQQQFEFLVNADNTHCDNEAFVVHKTRGITTLSSMHMQPQPQQHQDPLMPARLRQAKEKNNYETKADERGDNVAAGRPSNWDQNRRPSYAGRRSRRNSSSEDSQLTIENFGGSQDQLNAIDRFERERDRERKLSNTTIEPVTAARSSIIDARGTLQLSYDTDSGSEKQDHDTEKQTTAQQQQQHQQQQQQQQEQSTLNRQLSSENISLAGNAQNRNTTTNTNSTTPTQKHSNSTDLNNDDNALPPAPQPPQQQRDPNATLTRKSSNASMHMKSTNWQNNQSDLYDDDTRSLESAYKLTNIRLKLEEKRRMIEHDKRKIEMALMRYQEKVHQDDLDVDYMKWETTSNDSKRTSEIDPNELDKYQQSIAIMNMNLQDIQHDIQRLATQQNQIQAQQMQAQQLLQAQQIANMLNQQQQSFGSQQHLAADPYSPRPLSHQPNYGSSPHLPQTFNNIGGLNPYGSRPPSRDPYQQQQQQQQQQIPQPHIPMQYLNESAGQYIYGQPQAGMVTTLPQPPPSQYNPMPMHYNDNNAVPYNNTNHTAFMSAAPPFSNISMHAPISTHHHIAQQQPQNYIPSSRQSVYDDYAPIQSMLSREPNISPQPNNYYTHDLQRQQQPQAPLQTYPNQRRTWAQSSFDHTQLIDVNAAAWQTTPRRPTSSAPASQKSDDGSSAWGSPQQLDNNISHHRSTTLQQNGGDSQHQQLYPVHSSPIQRSSSGSQKQQQRNIVQRQQSMTNLRDTLSSSSSSNVMMPKASSAPTPPDDVMAPQSICFIGDEDDVDELERNIIDKMQSTCLSEYSFPIHHNQSQQQHQQQKDEEEEYEDYNNIMPQKLNITSGNLTYRIPSPQRPPLHANSFQDPRSSQKDTNEKGFYISFDDDQPKRPKPPLRAKRSPKKEKSLDGVDHQSTPHNRSDTISSSATGSDFVLNSKTRPKIHNHTPVGCGNGGGDSSNSDSQRSSMNNINKATYNKYTENPIQLSQVMALGNENNNYKNEQISKLIHVQLNNSNGKLESSQMQTPPPTPKFSNAPSPILQRRSSPRRQLDSSSSKTQALVLGTDVTTLDPQSMDEMERRKEKIMLMSLQRRQQQEEAKERKEQEAARKRELEREKEEEKQRKKVEQMARRAAILEQHRLKKTLEEAEREGKTLERSDLTHKTATHTPNTTRTRGQRSIRPRPKTIHVDDGSVDISESSSISSRGKKGSSSNITGYGQLSSNSMRRDYYRGSQDSLTVKESPDEYPSSSSTPIGRRGSYKLSKEANVERGRTLSRISVAKGSSLNFRGRKSNSLMNLCEIDSGIGRATPPRRAPSPGMITLSRQMPSPSGPGSLPPGLISKRRGMDDGSSDISSSTPNSMMEYSGPKLYKQPAAKSNRSIILNAVEYCVFPGAVNRDAKQKVLEKIARSEAKHFLILFRDAGCQFRALYSYTPESEHVFKLYGTGPSQVDEVMFDKFFKYNSGGKCFSQVHTKHLTVTIDAFTIHNSLWQGKKVHLPSKKDMALVI